MGRPLSPEVVRKTIQQIVNGKNVEKLELQNRNAQRGAIRKHIGDAIPDDFLRKITLGWLLAKPEEIIKPRSTNDLTDIEIVAIKRWIGAKPSENENDKSWEPEPGFEQEAQWCSWIAEEQFNTQTEKIVSGTTLAREAILSLGGIAVEYEIEKQEFTFED